MLSKDNVEHCRAEKNSDQCIAEKLGNSLHGTWFCSIIIVPTGIEKVPACCYQAWLLEKFFAAIFAKTKLRQDAL